MTVSIKPLSIIAVLLVSAALLASCGSDSGGRGVDLSQPVRFDPDAPIPERLSEFNLLSHEGDGVLQYNDRVVPYDLNTPLFSDYAIKNRAIYVPQGETVAFAEPEALDFPVGTIIVKTFSFPADMREPTRDVTLVETRVLVRYVSGWRAYPYVWDEDGGDAVLTPAGDTREIDFIGPEGEALTSQYLVPSRNQCQSCHERQEGRFGDAELVIIGPKARNLNRDHDYGDGVGVRNQLEYLAELGILTGLPDVTTVEAAYRFDDVETDGIDAVAVEDLDLAARSYLDINCGHCHSATAAQGITSQLFLNFDNDDPFNLGVCKMPGSAGSGTGGFDFDIVPGNADESILVFRVETEQVGAMMPLIGRSIRHTRGAALLRAWVDAMPADDCQSEE